MRSPAEQALTVLDDEAGEAHQIRIVDTEFSRGAFAICELFQDDFQKFQSIVCRMMALGALNAPNDPVLSRYSHKDDTTTYFDDALIEVSATMPLSQAGTFDRLEFIGRVEAIESEPTNTETEDAES